MRVRPLDQNLRGLPENCFRSLATAQFRLRFRHSPRLVGDATQCNTRCANLVIRPNIDQRRDRNQRKRV
jgi:hypothetical protein